ncbi:hypothetical protein AVEN_239806-1 [Araneus ventricosus]|uniref:Uncharacterized protein n=1 Tax=Araneus ventricosus TaxID=182803 RepID=A0A4Y2EWM5_ARAVE|nr:hypothetical protein AVEN_239806-1 [Araneus ventricosus]
MKRTSSNPAASAAPAKEHPKLNNSDGFTADSIPPHHENNYAVGSDFGDVINVHFRKFRTDENGRIFSTKNCVSFSPFVWRHCRTTCRDFPYHRIRNSEMFLMYHFNNF